MTPRRSADARDADPTYYSAEWFYRHAELGSGLPAMPTFAWRPEPPLPWMQRAIDEGGMRLCETCDLIPDKKHYHYVRKDDRHDTR